MLTLEERLDLRRRVLEGYQPDDVTTKAIVESLRGARMAAAAAGAKTKAKRKKETSDDRLDDLLADSGTGSGDEPESNGDDELVI